jgi:hypothetical protein
LAKGDAGQGRRKNEILFSVPLFLQPQAQRKDFEILKSYGLVDFVMAKIDISELSQAELSDLLVEVMFRLRQFEGEEVKITAHSVTKSQKLRLGESVRELLRQKCQ